MRKFVRGSFSVLSLLAALLAQGLTARPALAAAAFKGCQEGQSASGARYQICLPEGEWNGDLVVYAHGYVPSETKLALPGEASQFSSTVLPLGYAFATTSYRVNGLAVLPAQQDLLDLVELFRNQAGSPKRILLIGASEGGLITTLAVEQHPEIFAGGLELCGPVGDFQDQVNYFGDFRVVFDALFPGLIPPDPAHIPETTVNSWYRLYQSRILPALTNPANRDKVHELFSITGAPFDPAQPETMETTVRGALGYNIFATNDANARLGGNPYDNSERIYTGSEDDQALNQQVERVQADPQAVEALSAYRTSGRLAVPLVAIHTTGDEIVPFSHLDKYRQKVETAGRADLIQTIPVQRYGHCNFKSTEIQDAFTRLVQMVNQPQATVQPKPTIVTTTPALIHTQTPEPQSTISATPVPETPPAQNVLGRLWGWLVQTIRGLVQ